MVGVKNILDRTLFSLKNNLHSTERVAELCAQYHKKVLFTSSSEVYGKSQKKSFSEDDDLILGSSSQRRWSYASVKITEEHLFLAYAKEADLPVVITRLFNTVGERQSAAYGMVLPSFVQRALAGQRLEVYGDGTQQRCFCYVKDVVESLAKLMSAEQANGEVINIGSEELVTINQLAQEVIAQTNSASTIQYIPYEQLQRSGYADMIYRRPNIEKAKHLISFSPRLRWKDVVTKVIDAQRKELEL